MSGVEGSDRKNPLARKTRKQYDGIEMAHSVIITTPMPTLDELGKELGLTRAEQKLIIRLVDEKTSRRPASYALKSLTGPARKEAGNASGRARKTKSRARKAA